VAYIVWLPQIKTYDLMMAWWRGRNM